MNEISSMVISHKKATVAEMECAWPLTTEEMLEKLYESELVYECVILKTCNRAEIYVVSEKGSSVLFNFSKAIGVETRIVDFHDHEESLDHLLRLSCGLESMIMGEDQILGQIRDAYNLAVKKKTIGRILDTAFTKAIQVGKRARTETRINEGSVSIGSAAVELAEDTLGGLDGKTIMVVGVGEIGVLVARALADKNLEGIYISNRTHQKAQELAYDLGGEAILFDDVPDYLKNADVVISATGAPHYVITKKIVEEAVPKRNGKPLFMVDIANPRDIEESVNDLDGVTLCNIDNLRVISEKTLKMRNEEAKKVIEIINEELDLLGKQYKRQKADDIIAALYRSVYDIREEEKQKAVNKFRVKHTIGDFEEKILENLTHSIANQILAEPTKILRNAAESDDDDLLEAVARVFNIEHTTEE
ncbi:glutamyl-tRNA reductase [Methanimicrococcus blatticola]|uniref:Glutamyl-tRNA reductase n=1 Tax=Methanimicrococcus blatticola TaxID=91560 RepID=A0A484F5E0_9EURY|nr:glutamyl-tRNA reductase [Methanimicrococcus blatticola]MBZ3935748.1 glutamyl-tRNA reductase [Methanimicrococcus blatticola]MCC2508132.1 glutamyl-tRNA reductase [Methanimicrococcus blatticola]TDQ68789.1 glutamyl-tRNA reductase [Methanimicrococcus blatticola]